MSIARMLLLKASQSHWLGSRLPRYPFARRAVRRFMPGETCDDALAECAVLTASKIRTVVTHLGENITDAREAAAVAAHYSDVLRQIRQRALPTHISVKLTQLGLDSDPGAVVRSVVMLMREAGAEPVWIDMEGSQYTDPTISVFREARQSGPNVGLCVQAYLKRTPADIDALLATTTALRLVKGAYREPAAIALARKTDVDASYIACARQLLDAARRDVVGHVPAFATHDVEIIRKITAIGAAEGVDRERYEFQLLYGINVPEQRRLARAGFRVRVLISYGDAWFAWYMRRLAERPANVWFLLKNLV